MWKKRPAIEGVSSSSIVGLKAELYEKEQAVKRFKSGEVGAAQPTARRATGTVSDVFTRGSNRGVAERASRDLLGDDGESRDQLSKSRTKLEEKARKYNALLGSNVGSESEALHSDRAPLVDFQLKSWQHSADDGDYAAGQTTFDSQLQSADTIRERERRRWEIEQQQEKAQEAARNKRIETIETVIAQTAAGREQARVAQEQRLHAQRARLDLVQKKAAQRSAAVKMAQQNNNNTAADNNNNVNNNDDNNNSTNNNSTTTSTTTSIVTNSNSNSLNSVKSEVER